MSEDNKVEVEKEELEKEEEEITKSNMFEKQMLILSEAAKSIAAWQEEAESSGFSVTLSYGDILMLQKAVQSASVLVPQLKRVIDSVNAQSDALKEHFKETLPSKLPTINLK